MLSAALGVAVFEIQQAALHEGLQRAHAEAQARGLHHRLHARIDEEVFEELIFAVEAE